MKHLIILLTGFILPVLLYAQTTYTWNQAGNGNWSTAANWTPARTSPAASDILVISNGGTKTISNVQTQTIGRLIVAGNTQVTLMPTGGSRTLTINNGGLALDLQSGSSLTLIGESSAATRNLTLRFTGAGNTASIAGTLELAAAGNDRGILNLTNSATSVSGMIRQAGGSMTSSVANLDFQAGSIYEHAINGGNVPTATWNAASVCRITGVTNALPGGLTQSFGHFTWDAPGQTASLTLNGVLTSIAGDFTVANTGSAYGIYLTTANNSSYSLTVGGDLNITTGGWLIVSGGDNVTATVNVTGNVSITSAAADCGIYLHLATGGSMTLNKIILNVAGNFSQAGGLVDMAYGDSNISNYTELHLGGDFSLSGSGIFYTGTGDNSIRNGLLVFNKAGIQTLYAATPANMPYINYSVENGATVQLLSDVELSSMSTAVWAGQFTITNGGTLDAGTFRVYSSTGASAGVNNAFTVDAGGKVITANAAGLQQDATTGTVSTALAIRSFHSDAVYEFQTGVMGSFVTAPAANTVRTLVVNNSAGVTLSQPLTVTNSLELTEGILITSMVNLLTINDNATATGGSYSPLRYIDGPVRKIGDDAFTFPVGKSGTYAPASISAPAVTSAEFRAEYFRGTPPNRSNITAPGLTQISFCEYWDIEEVGPGSPTVNVSLSWSGLSPCNAASYVTDINALTVAHYDGTNWNSHSNNGGFSGNAVQGQVTRNTVSSFSIFTLGSTSATSNPLSVKFNGIKAHTEGSLNIVEWSNLAEAGVNYYTLEKSVTGNTFEAVTVRNARSNNGGKETYLLTDADSRPVLYYRIKAVEMSGETSYSAVVKLVRNQAATDNIQVYPNPVTQKQVAVQCRNGIRETLQLEMYNGAGVMLFRKPWQHPGGMAVQTIDLPGQMPPGMYLLRITGSAVNEVIRLIVQ